MSNLDTIKAKYNVTLADDEQLVKVIGQVNNIKESLDDLVELIKTRNF